MTKPFSVLSKSAFVVLFACSAMPAFAQHGGGGHGGGGGGSRGGGGGGFHGGGGGGVHPSGGGMRSSGGGGPRGGSYAPPAAGYGAPRAAAPSPMRSGGGFVSRPGNSYSRPGNSFVPGNQRFGNSVSAPPAASDGRWHSFGNASGSRGPSGAPSESGASGNNGGWHVLSGNRASGSGGSVRSFSGQGGEVWENSTASRNVVPRSQSLSSIHNSVTSSLAAKSTFRSNSPLSSPSRLGGGAPLMANRGFSSTANGRNSLQQLRGSNRFDRPFRGWRGGCWNCGFGFGGWGNQWGWGFGWGGPWLGFWGWNPFWIDPWWGWPSGGYGYYGNPTNNYYIYNDSGSGYTSPDGNAEPAPQQNDENENQYDQNNSNGNWVTPNGPSPALAPPSGSPNDANLTVPVLIYMKNGGVLSVRDYWMIDGELHYILVGGDQKTVDLDLVDLSRTNTENAKSGVKFIFKSEPSAPPPDEHFTPPAKPNSSQPGASTQPDART
jgi:hypothetical protein